MSKEVGHDHAKGAIKLYPILGGCYEVAGDGILCRTFRGIENESVFLAFLTRLCCGIPLSSCFHDCVKFLDHRWVVAVLPPSYDIFL